MKQNKAKSSLCSLPTVIGTIGVIQMEIPLLIVLDWVRTRNAQVDEFGELQLRAY
jgi:hypothetical protein